MLIIPTVCILPIIYTIYTDIRIATHQQKHNKTIAKTNPIIIYTKFLLTSQQHIKQKMKKLLSILNIPQATQCQNLQTDYKIQRKNLKRYQQSLKTFKTRLSQNVQLLQNTHKTIFSMHQNQSKSRKKNSQLEYYMYNGVKVFGIMIAVYNTASLFYEDLLKRIATVQQKISKCLQEQKTKHTKQSQQHQKEIKTLAAQCYPETTSILFMLGLVSTEKIVKKQDSFREMSAVEESKRYAAFLNLCLEEMEEIKKQVMEIGRMYYEGAKDMWIQGIDQLRETLEDFTVNVDQVNKIAEQTGRVLTDRSNKSNDDIRNQESGNFDMPQDTNEDVAHEQGEQNQADQQNGS